MLIKEVADKLGEEVKAKLQVVRELEDANLMLNDSLIEAQTSQAQVQCAFSRQKFTLEEAIGSHACSLEANMRATNGIPLGSSLSYQLTL